MTTPTDPRRRHKLAGFATATTSLLAFALLTWPPAALLVTAAAGITYAREQNQ